MLTERRTNLHGERGRRMKEKDHLPLYGVGPLLCGVMTVVSLIALVYPRVSGNDVIVIHGVMRIVAGVCGAFLMAFSIALWIDAVQKSDIDAGILENRLVTDGAYALTRNPIYSAVLLLCIGILLLAGNLLAIPLTLLFWLFLTVALKETEEKWLLDLYGGKYRQYCARVNRIWPDLKKFRQ